MKLASVLAAVLAIGLGGVVGAESPMVSPEQAIAAAVADRFGAPVEVTVDRVSTKVAAEAGLVAQAPVAARAGKPTQFVLSVKGVRRGLATATVTVVGRHPRAARVITRDEEIGGDAVSFTTAEMRDVPMQPLLGAAELKGLRARRDIITGEPLTAAILRLPPVVKSGDEVEVTIRIRAVRVTGSGYASGSGQVGDMIRITQPNSSRLLKGRITGPGAVEVVE